MVLHSTTLRQSTGYTLMYPKNIRVSEKGGEPTDVVNELPLLTGRTGLDWFGHEVYRKQCENDVFPDINVMYTLQRLYIAIRGSHDSQTQRVRLYEPWEIHWTWIVLLLCRGQLAPKQRHQIMWFVCACSVTCVHYSLADPDQYYYMASI